MKETMARLEQLFLEAEMNTNQENKQIIKNTTSVGRRTEGFGMASDNEDDEVLY